ncbi:MAG: hypothetical protein BZY81_06095 [SAR202 cluster bacterium Io17-Chloro-G4]|nr:MAG: hypothetical protein BZY81_06095 [SAR202 cluster bacterium Io17-Chloro-G4]
MATKLLQVIHELGISFQDVQRFSQGRLGISAKTISDIANGRTMGSERSRRRILGAINVFANSRKGRSYDYEDLFEFVEKVTLLPHREPIKVKGKPLSRQIIDERR